MKTGDLVVTSGIDGIYPKGFVIGTIENVSRGAGQYHEITVRPTVDFSRLEEVLVVRTLPPSRTLPEGGEVKSAAALAAIVVALALQTTLAGLVIRGTAALDLVLIVVVYIALKSGPVTGLLAGTVAGLIQDALSNPILGIGGLAKTIVGFLAGLLGTQFILNGPLPRFVVIVMATDPARGDLHGALRLAGPPAVSGPDAGRAGPGHRQRLRRGGRDFS